MEQSTSWEANKSSVEKFLAFMEPISSLPHSQKPDTWPYSEARLPNLLLENPFQYYPPI